MNDKMAMNLISEIMGWDESGDATAAGEYAWLRLMSSVKYDGYSDFRAGARFVESLAAWLKQFAKADRHAAYEFVKHRLVYVSPAEMQRLIEAFVPEIVTPNLRRATAEELGVEPYEIWSTNEGSAIFNRRLRQTLFVGMSDGSRIDGLRRSNSRRLSTEQVVPMMNIDDEKWLDLSENLAKELGKQAKFQDVYLVDDFTASGTTFIRKVDGGWKGKLKKFNVTVVKAREKLGELFPIADGYRLNVHHYVSSHQAKAALMERMAIAASDWTERSYGDFRISEGLLLPDDLRLESNDDAAVLALCDRYYDPSLFERLKKHCQEAGQTSMARGYADCALPIVLDHNTPNNSIPLLWAETAGSGDAHAMRPLFRRRDRHG